MSDTFKGAIDCDIHPRVPTPRALARYMDDHWRDTIEVRGIETWDTISYPPNAPLTSRPDWRKAGADTEPGEGGARRRSTASASRMPSAIPCFRSRPSATRTWQPSSPVRSTTGWRPSGWTRTRACWARPCCRSSRSSESVEEIERRAADKRFVQVLMLAMGEHPLGKSMYWPIYAAAERHGFTVGIHAGSSYHHALTGSGWPTYYLEDYAAQSLGFHTQLGSLICEGVFVKYPKLKVVLIESGITWLPPYLWRLSKFWRGVRNEVPWIDRSPEEFVRDHVRLTIQPFDAPPVAAHIGRIMDQLQSDDMLLFSTDFPHWQFDGDEMLPAGLSPALRKKILIDNPLATYPRLGRPS